MSHNCRECAVPVIGSGHYCTRHRGQCLGCGARCKSGRRGQTYCASCRRRVRLHLRSGIQLGRPPAIQPRRGPDVEMAVRVAEYARRYAQGLPLFQPLVDVDTLLARQPEPGGAYARQH